VHSVLDFPLEKCSTGNSATYTPQLRKIKYSSALSSYMAVGYCMYGTIYGHSQINSSSHCDSGAWPNYMAGLPEITGDY